MSKYIFDNSRNPLLVKDDVGRAKPSCYDLPKNDFTFGNAQGADVEGAAEITRTWATHVPSNEKKTSRVNYISFNKSLGRAKLSDCRPSTGGRYRRKENNSESGADGAFGKKTRSSTPIGNVIGNQFAAEYEVKMDQKNLLAAQEMEGRSKRKVICTTRAAEGHKRGADQRKKAMDVSAHGTEDKPRFKLSKFANVKPTFTLPKNVPSANSRSKPGSVMLPVSSGSGVTGGGASGSVCAEDGSPTGGESP